MGEVSRARLKVALSHHYAAQREDAAEDAIDALATAMAAEDARAADGRGARLRHAAFVAAQVRYIPAWTWVAHLALVVLMGMVAGAAGDSGATRIAIGMLSAASVLVGVPAMGASKRHNVAELEFACLHNEASLLVARLIVLGCSSALAVTVMVTLVAGSLDTSVFAVALWACPPYFFSCAGCLMTLRKASPTTASTLCAVWALACCGTLLALANALPDMYAHVSLATWAGAAAAAAGWLAREVAMACRTAAAGLDTFSPHMAKTYH